MNGLVSVADNHIAFSGKVGGAVAVFEGQPKVLVGGCMFKNNQLPLYPNGILPAGTPVYCDEVARTFDVHYEFEVLEAVSAKKIFKVKKGREGSRIQEGMILIAEPTDLTATVAATAAYTVASVDRSNEGYDSVTVDKNITLAVGAILVEAKASGDNYVVKVLPNALTDRDKVRYADTYMVDGAAIFACDGAVLSRRIPPICAAIKEYMRKNDCFFRYSNHK